MKSHQLMIASVLCGVTALALATTPCGWPQAATFNSGGSCVKPTGAAAYCTQPSLATNGGCFGQDNTKTCLEGARVREMPYYILRAPASGCNVTNPCIANPPQVTSIPYTHAEQSTTNCVTTGTTNSTTNGGNGSTTGTTNGPIEV